MPETLPVQFAASPRTFWDSRADYHAEKLILAQARADFGNVSAEDADLYRFLETHHSEMLADIELILEGLK